MITTPTPLLIQKSVTPNSVSVRSVAPLVFSMHSITLRPDTITGKRIIHGFFKIYMMLIYYDAFTACKYRAKVSFSV